MFYVSLLEQNTTKKRRMNKFPAKFEMGKDKKYKVKAIRDSAVYAKETDRYLPGLYYLVA